MRELDIPGVVHCERFERFVSAGSHSHAFAIVSQRAVKLDALGMQQLRLVTRPGGTVLLFVNPKTFNATEFDQPVGWCQTVALSERGDSAVAIVPVH